MGNLTKGLWSDGDPRVQPTGTWRKSKNNVIVSTEGDYVLTNEKGFSKFSTLPTNFLPIGDTYVGSNSTVLFLIGINGNVGTDQIGLLDRSGRYTTIVSTSLLTFQITHQIKGTYITNTKGERVVYWTDGFNPPRYLNIDNPAPFVTAEDYSLFFLHVQPRITLAQVNDTGGSLHTGVYQFCIQLLDPDFNESNFLGFTEEYPISNKPLSTSNFNYDGSDPDIATTKSIAITIDDLRGNLGYYRIGVIKTINGVSTYIKSSIHSLPQDVSQPFTYVYANDNDFSASTVQEITQTYSSYTTADTIAQINNILMLGKLKQDLDLAYQPYANMITVNYRVDEFDMDDTVDSTGSYKNPATAVLKGFMRDEVYALGIVWLFKDGTESFVYHIPGRHKMTGVDWDGTTDYTTTDNVYGTDSLWKAGNTSESDTLWASNDSLRLGYYESVNEIYPNTDEWDSSAIGGEDLREKKVRHHRMPDIYHSHHYRNNDIASNPSNPLIHWGRRISLTISNVQLPPQHINAIAGYKIVRVQRTDTRKSVLGQGGLFNLWFTHYSSSSRAQVINSFPFSSKPYLSSGPTSICRNTDIGVFGGTGQDIKNQFTYMFPEGRFGAQSGVTPDYLQQEWIGYGTDALYGTSGLIQDNTTWDTLHVSGRLENLYTDESFSSNKRIRIDSTFSIGNNTYNNLGSIDFDNGRGQSCNAIVTTDSLSYAEDIVSGLGTFLYNTEATAGVVKSLFAPNHGDNGFAIWVSNLKKKWFDQYFGLQNLTYIDTGYTYYFPDGTGAYSPATKNHVYGGDTFISNFWFRRTVGGNKDYYQGGSSSGLPTGATAVVPVQTLLWMPVESTINIDMRHSGADLTIPDSSDTKWYYPKKNTIWTGTVNSTVLELDPTIDNYFAYNRDYSYEPQTRIYVAKPANLTEVTTFNTRIAYSIRKNDEETSDSYRQFLVNNYIDLPKNKGNLVDIVVKNGAVHGHMEHTIFQIPTDEQRLSTLTGVTASIGNGEFLSMTPIELVNLESGYGGLHSRWASVMTPYGYLFMDAQRYQVYLYDNKLTELRMEGLRTFFNNNSKLELAEQLFAATGIELQQDNPANPNGIGYCMGYDPWINRAILYKQDYRLDPAYSFKITTQLSSVLQGLVVLPTYILYYNGNFYDFNGNSDLGIGTFCSPDPIGGTYHTVYPRLLTLASPVFIDNSFTLSYSFDIRAWVSNHDYKTSFMWTTDRLFASLQNYPNASDVVWEFNTGNYGHFNDDAFGQSIISPSVVDVILEPGSAHKQYQTILLSTKREDSTGTIQESTFGQYMLYNSYQCSGYINIVEREGARYVRGIWQINRFRDLQANYATPPLTNDEPTGINSSKPWTQQKRFTDTYLACRLVNDNTSNNKLSLYDLDSLQREIKR